jgi:poly(3-hydroxybutyrate) depolymerase
LITDRLIRFGSLAAVALLPLAGPALGAPAPLGAYNVDPAAISISGLSAGAFFAMQMGIAYSSTIMGVGIFAGGPYDCARQVAYVGCLANATPANAAGLANLQAWSGTRIDPVSNIARQRIYLFTGSADVTVGPKVTGQVEGFYVADGRLLPAAQLKYEQLAGASHTFPTNVASSGDNPCNLSVSPFISDCGFDGAGAALQWIYGTLTAPPATPPAGAGATLAFDQAPYGGGAHGLAASGWIHVPAACTAATSCRLHVALHGCLQAGSMVGQAFVDNAGYIRWADANRIIVLFPQAQADGTPHLTAASGWLPNPAACWDWVGWYGEDFDQKSGVQMKAIAAMIERVASGNPSVGSAPAAPAPGTSARLIAHWASGRIDWAQFVELAKAHGALAQVTLYRCASGWREHADCTEAGA